jgi:hypothetical protein
MPLEPVSATEFGMTVEMPPSEVNRLAKVVVAVKLTPDLVLPALQTAFRWLVSRKLVPDPSER